MPCDCGLADECDGEHATYYPLQDGGMCSVRPCERPVHFVDLGGFFQVIDGPKPPALEWDD